MSRYVEGIFLPTPSARRATAEISFVRVIGRFLPTPSARRATNIFVGIPPTSEISTHALREEGDVFG